METKAPKQSKFKEFTSSPSGVIIKSVVVYPTFCILAITGVLVLMMQNEYLSQTPLILILLFLYPITLGVAYLVMWEDIKESRGFYTILRLLLEPHLSTKNRDKGIFLLISTIWYLFVVFSLLMSLVSVV